MVTGRDVVLVFNGCYHGSVEEAHVAPVGGKMVMRSGVHPNAIDHARVSRVVEFNDLAALEAALAPRDVVARTGRTVHDQLRHDRGTARLSRRPARDHAPHRHAVAVG
jgi:hypothetical protein